MEKHHLAFDVLTSAEIVVRSAFYMKTCSKLKRNIAIDNNKIKKIKQAFY